MIEFLYTGDYTELEPSTRLLHHVQVYTLAEKCSIESLKDHARSKLSRVIGQTPVLEEEDLAAATRHNYENMAPNDCSVHDILISTIVGNMDVFLRDETSPICNLMAEIGEVGRDVARATCFSVGPQQRKPPPESDLGSIKFYHCSSCASEWMIRYQETSNVWDGNPICPRCYHDLPEGETTGLVPRDMFNSWVCKACNRELYSTHRADTKSLENTWRCCYTSCMRNPEGFRAVLLS